MKDATPAFKTENGLILEKGMTVIITTSDDVAEYHKEEDKVGEIEYINERDIAIIGGDSIEWYDIVDIIIEDFKVE